MSPITKEFTKEQLIEGLKTSKQNSSGMFEIGEETICALMSMLTNAAPQLPHPAVLSVPDEIPKLKDGSGFKYVKDGVRYSLNYANGWNQCRAAMLKGADDSLTHEGKNHHEDKLGMVNNLGDVTEKVIMLQGAEPASNCDELPLAYLQGHKDGLEWAAQLAEANHPQTGDWLYDDPIELSKAIRKGPDMPLSDGNSPVIQDGWIKCSERMPEDEQEVLTRNRMGHCFVSFFDEHSGLFFDRVDVAAACCIEHILVTHWMPLPAAPQQEE